MTSRSMARKGVDVLPRDSEADVTANVEEGWGGRVGAATLLPHRREEARLRECAEISRCCLRADGCSRLSERTDIPAARDGCPEERIEQSIQCSVVDAGGLEQRVECG